MWGETGGFTKGHLRLPSTASSSLYPCNSSTPAPSRYSPSHPILSHPILSHPIPSWWALGRQEASAVHTRCISLIEEKNIKKISGANNLGFLYII